MLNFWKRQIPEPRDAFRNDRIRPAIDHLLSEIARSGGQSEENQRVAVDRAFSLIEGAAEVTVFECEMKAVFAQNRSAPEFRETIHRRSEIVYSEIEPYLTGSSMLDIGAGNGFISDLCKGQIPEILMLDVVDYVNPEIRLPFQLYREGSGLPVDRGYDTVLLLTVLHHAQNPLHLLLEAWRCTGAHLIIIESVFGSTPKESGPRGDGPYSSVEGSAFDQLCFAVIVDWLYNRVLHDDIPVPYNFMEPDGWVRLFRSHSMDVSVSINLGRDIEIAPELHHLYVLSR